MHLGRGVAECIPRRGRGKQSCHSQLISEAVQAGRLQEEPIRLSKKDNHKLIIDVHTLFHCPGGVEGRGDLDHAACNLAILRA